MSGSVREWCEESKSGDGYRVLRGGSWRMMSYESFLSNRRTYLSAARDDDIGFRVARNAEE
jgi:formylglycine-generating enzyme required for sulfatase activity